MLKQIAQRAPWIGFLLIAFAFSTTTSFRAAETSQAASEEHHPPDLRLESQQIADSTAKPKPLRILVIGAHPADVFDQSGGTMAHHIKRGDWVGCAVLTTGVRVHDKVIVNEMHDRKEIPAAEE